MKGIKKEARKKISVYRRDLWDRYELGYESHREMKEIHIKETTGGIRLHRRHLKLATKE